MKNNNIYFFKESGGENGVIEVNGRQAESFSQDDVNQKLVTYTVHTPKQDATSFEIALQVSDGMETSQTDAILVSVHPLQLRMINNTGLIIIHKSFTLITPSNLSFTTNSEDENVEIRYNIVRQPHHGSIQKLRAVDSSWISVESFTSTQLSSNQLRYHHTSQEFPPFDDFKFSASLHHQTSSIYDFRITFTKLRIGVQRHQNIIIEGTQDTIIKNQGESKVITFQKFLTNFIQIFIIKLHRSRRFQRS